MRKNGLIRMVSLVLIAGMACVGCQTGDAPQETTTEALTESTPEATAEQTTAEPTVTETSSATDTETQEPETTPPEPADGIFDEPTRLSGFEADKNKDFLKGKQCSVRCEEDGSLLLEGSVTVGKRFSPKLTIDYADMMAACWPGYTARADLPNGGTQKYRAIVMTVEGEAAQIAECDLYFSTGKRNVTQNTILPTVLEADEAGRTRLVFDMGASFTEDYLNSLVFTWDYAVAADERKPEMKIHEIELFTTVEAAYEAIRAEAPVAEDVGTYPLGISKDQLNELIRDIFSGNTVKNETVMFLDAGDEKELLYDIAEVIAVTSYDGTKTYREGVDYAVRDGKLVALEGGQLPLITSERYYGADSSSLLMTEYNGKKVYTHWGEGRAMTDWQVNVTYTHNDPWDGYDQACEARIYADFIRKLQNGEDVTVIFYGDSCTYGAASSFSYGYAPYQYSYSLLLTNALADLFGYTVRYINPGLSGTGPIPSQSYVAGTNGTITYINPSVGGWASGNALSSMESYLLPFVETYGCDLFVLDIGGNDGSGSAEAVRANDEAIIRGLASKASEDVCVIIMSTLVNNPDSVNGWAGTEYLQEPQLRKAAAALRKEGIRVGNCCMTSITLSVLEHVTYNDISGNNINHPNDFWARMYACTLFENLIGYGNLTD